MLPDDYYWCIACRRRQDEHFDGKCLYQPTMMEHSEKCVQCSADGQRVHDGGIWFGCDCPYGKALQLRIENEHKAEP